MKKIVSTLLVVILAVMLVVSMGSVALAADSIKTSVKISPSSLAGAGTVNVTVNVTNNGDPIKNVVLKYPSPTDTEVQLGDMATGESKERSDPNWAISEDMLGKELKFMVYWTSSDGTQRSGSTEAFVIARQESSLNVTGNAEASVTQINKGDKVTFAFSMKNEGNVKVDAAYLNAPPIDNGAKIGSDFSLEPGSTKQMKYTVTVNQSMDVKPVFTYTAGGQQYTLQLNTVSVKVDEASQKGALSAAVDVDKTQVESGGNVRFDLRINNTGQTAINNISVKDFDGNTVTVSPTSLGAGERATGYTEIPITVSGSYSFRVTATDANGNSLSADSNAVDIVVDGEAAQPTDDLSKMLKLNMSLPTNLPEPTEITAKIEVLNQSEEIISNVVVSAVDGDTAKTLGTLESLAAGQSEQMEAVMDIRESVNYVFKVTGQLPDGTLVESQTTSVPITVTGEGSDGGISSTMLGVIIVLIAIAAVAIFLGVYISRQRKKSKAKTAERGKQAQRQQQVSPNGRVRPPRYNANGNANGEEGRPDTRRYGQRPQQRVETIEPKQQQAPEPKPRPQQRPPQSGSGTKYGDRNKF